MESGDGHRALRRHHRAVGARARDPHRAAVRVPRRRGAAEPAHQRGHAAARARGRPRVDRRARPGGRSSRCTTRSRPSPTTADDLHDLLSLAGGRARPRPSGRPLFDELAARGRGRGARAPRRTTLWCTTERRDDAAPRVRRRRGRGRPRSLRGHLEITGITTVDELAVVDHAHRRARAGRARRTSSRAASRSRGTTRDQAVDTEWVARRLLARMHSYSRRTRRGGVEPATAQDFMRFLLRWQHVAPGTQLAGEAGLAHGGRAAPGLRGRRGGVGARPARRAGCAATTRAWLDRLCHDGEVGVAAADAAGARRPTRPSGAPSKATPISVVVPRRPSVAARRGARGHRSRRAGRRRAPPRSSRCCASAARASPPSSARRPTASPRTSSARCGTASPAACSCPTASAPIRARVAHGKRTTDVRALLAARPRRHGSPARRPGAGRWCRPPRSTSRSSPAATATSWPRRSPSCCSTGGACSSATSCVHDSLRFPWRDLQWALRRLEDRGLVRGGRFVSGFSGEQYALPEAAEQLTQTRKAAPHRRAGHRERHRPAEPGRGDRARRPGPGGAHPAVTYVDGVVEGTADTERARSA